LSDPAPALAKKLARLGIRSREDLVVHLPSRYEDETHLTAVEAAPQGKPVLVQARVLRADVAFRPKRQLVVHAEGLVLRFLNFYGSQLKQFQRATEDGRLVRAYGEVRPGFFGAEMVHPRYRIVDAGEPLPTSLTPIYPTTASLSQRDIRGLVHGAVNEIGIAETLPVGLRRKHALVGIGEAIGALHRPAPDADTAALVGRSSPEWRRIKFDELLAQQLSLRMAYSARRARSAYALSAEGPLLRRFLGKLPFRLTRAQRKAMAEVLADLAVPHPMQRLLQGDVGSGKTIVAAIACLAAVDAGYQAAVMAPTEILAEQNLRKFSEWLAPLGVRIVWLHGGLTAAERKRVAKALAEPAPVVAIGTHALFQKGVGFARLALAVVDEQHRFGVQQRLALRRKSEAAIVPHQLMMSATPIPRTLSMSQFADLDISTIDELPLGRKPVTTKLFSAAKRKEVLARIREACAEGQQAYWVCPVIEESKDDNLQTAIETHELLRGELEGLQVGLIHGRLPAEEKALVMKKFIERKVLVLVATTVIEVGVDVPNASLMVIEHAERFGLAQLHQLRGRIGRGARESTCILLYAEPLSDDARARLKVIFETTDGFRIAQADLDIRGPGDYLGERQSGDFLLRYADLRDRPLVEEAIDAARELLEQDPRAARRHVERWLGARTDNLRA
jgi:ATP-dependent DNA helicase RecG